MELNEIDSKIKDWEKKIRLMPSFPVEEEDKFIKYTNEIDEEAIQLFNDLNEVDKQINGHFIKDYAYRIKNGELDFKIKQIDNKQKCNSQKVDKKLQDAIVSYNNIVDKIQGKLKEIITEHNKNEIKINEINEIKNNLFNFFGLIVGLLAFIFVNFQLITTATSLSLGKMIIYMGLSNVGLITGIIIILDVLSIILDKKEKLGLIELVIGKSKIVFALVPLILIVGGVVYYFFDRPENYQVLKRIEILESNNNSDTRIDDLKSNQDKILEDIDKIQDENKELREKLNKKEAEMTILINEIKNLKSKENEK